MRLNSPMASPSIFDHEKLDVYQLELRFLDPETISRVREPGRGSAIRGRNEIPSEANPFGIVAKIIPMKGVILAAEQIPPNRCRSGRWWRLQAKRLLGQGLWRRLRPALNRFRGVPETLLEPPATLCRPAWARSGHEIGWWAASA